MLDFFGRAKDNPGARQVEFVATLAQVRNLLLREVLLRLQGMPGKHTGVRVGYDQSPALAVEGGLRHIHQGPRNGFDRIDLRGLLAFFGKLGTELVRFRGGVCG